MGRGSTSWQVFGFVCAVSVSVSCAARGPSAPPATATEPHEQAGPTQHVVLISVDGLMPDAYLHPDTHGLAIPTLRDLVARGAYSDGALSVLPSVTYPAHTTMVTGVTPRRHGIISNHTFDPLGANHDGWYWYAEDIRVAPLWQLAENAGKRTALVSWPVSVGARVSWLLPEYWRAGTPEDVKLVRALATPDLLQQVSRDYPDIQARYAPYAVGDDVVADVVSHLIKQHRPALVMAHMAEVDGAQHGHGPFSPEALAAIENADRQLARVMAAVRAAGTLEHTAFVVVSDHGFAKVQRKVQPNALLREAGLLSVDEKQRVIAWKAAALVNGGLAYVYLQDPADTETRNAVLQLFSARAGQVGSGIGRMLSPSQVGALGGDEHAMLALEAEDGTYFGDGHDSYEGAHPIPGIHGYDPRRPDMKASLLMLGPQVKPGLLKDAELVDVAPTIANWLGLNMTNVEGEVLGVH